MFCLFCTDSDDGAFEAMMRTQFGFGSLVAFHQERQHHPTPRFVTMETTSNSPLMEEEDGAYQCMIRTQSEEYSKVGLNHYKSPFSPAKSNVQIVMSKFDSTSDVPPSRHVQNQQDNDMDHRSSSLYGKTKQDMSNLRSFRKADQSGGSLNNEEVVFEFQQLRKLPPSESLNGRYKEFETEFEINHNLGNFVNDIFIAQNVVDDAFERMIAPLLTEANDKDRISITLDTMTDNDYYVAFTSKANFDKESLLNAMAQISQSNRSQIFANGVIKIKVGILKHVSGKGKRPIDGDSNIQTSFKKKRIESKAPKLINDFFTNKRSVITINNKDHLCGYMAFTIGWIFANDPNMIKTNNAKWKMLIHKDSLTLKNETLTLFKSLDICTSTPFDNEKAQETESKIENCQIIIIPRADPKSKGGEFLYRGSRKSKQVILEWIAEDPTHPEGHFNFVKTPKAYYGTRGWCDECFVGFHTLMNHKCQSLCDKCCTSPVCDRSQPLIRCLVCNLEFYGEQCVEKHFTTSCTKRSKCQICERTYSTKNKHTCGVYYCQICNQNHMDTPHFCIINPKDKQRLMKEDKPTKVFVTFDIEATQTEVDEKGYSTFKANLLISHTVCDDCYDYEAQGKRQDFCTTCGTHERIFFSEHCVQDFIKYVCDDLGKKIGKTKSKIFVWAHNFKGFDGRFILRSLWDRNYKDMNMVMTGSKILMIDIGCVRFLDSLSFFQMSLDKCAKSFKDKKQRLKGDFPHHANKEKNYKYIGPMFPIDQYAIKYMSDSKKQEFTKWYIEMVSSNRVFNFMTEFVNYCRNDVEILEFSVMQFRKLFMAATGLCPFTRCFTLASIGQETFRSGMMKKDIGIVPNHGYVPLWNSSLKEHAWLDLVQKEKGISLIKQKRIGPYSVDGYHKETNTVYEFNGCHWHGCMTCYPTDRKNMIFVDMDKVARKTTYESLYNDWLKKEDLLRRLGFNVEHLWEHDLDLQDSYVKSRLLAWTKIKSLGKDVIRRSLCGGRTNNFVFNHVCTEDEKILYLDFTSLYPWTLKYCDYPVGHPTVITENFRQDLKDYFGFVSCKVLPPNDLDHPVLPFRLNGKLLFPLCGKCAESSTQDFCHHSDEERCLEGTWTTPELNKSLEKGYKIQDIFLVHDYGKNVARDMFSEYIDMWLRYKQQSSDWPSHVKTEEDKLKYIAEYEQKEGVKMDYNEISRNDGLRLISKLCLNSFWGKLGQRPNMKKTETVTSHQRLWELECDDKISILGKTIVSNKAVVVNFEYKDVEDSNPGNTSPAIASFVTSWARLKLYDLMDKINIRPNRLLYVDTDSAIFVFKEGDEEIPTGDYLGELTDEFEKDYAGFTCYQVIFGGPKSYCMKLRKTDPNTGELIEKCILKSKGITLCSATNDALNPQVMETITNKFVETGTRESILVPQQQFSALPMKQVMRRREYKKQWKVTSDKRVIKGNFTFPYGFRRPSGEIQD